MPNAYAIPQFKPPVEAATQAPLAKGAAGKVAEISQMDLARQFQDQLDAGQAAMAETYKTLPADIRAGVGEPGAYAESEQKRAMWYMMVNDALAKQELRGQVQSGDTEGAKEAALTAPLSPESGKQVSGFVADAEQGQRNNQIQDIVQAPAAVAPAGPPQLDMKSQLGRTVRTVSARLVPFETSIASAAKQNQLPIEFVKAVITQESRGKHESTSKAGAQGMMQLMPATAAELGVDSTDAEQNIAGGTKYLGQMMSRFGGDIEKALAAYNAGPGRVQKLITEHGEDWKTHLPEETKDYLPSVMKYFTAYGGTKPQQQMSAADLQMKFASTNPALLQDKGAQQLVQTLGQGQKSDSFNDIALARLDLSRESQTRLNKKLEAEMDDKLFKQSQPYLKHVKTVGPAAQAVIRIDKLVGGVDGNQPIPGFGIGAKTFKNFMMTDVSPEARDLRIAFADLFSGIGLATSGQNFTASEMARLEDRLGSGALASEGAFRQAMRQQRDNMYQSLLNQWSTVPEEAKQTLRDHGAITPDWFGQFQQVAPGTTGGGAGGGQSKTTKSGKKYLVEEVK